MHLAGISTDFKHSEIWPGPVFPMILLTRLNNRPLVVNSDMIKFIENTPDTVLTLVTGEKIVVLETVAEVLEEILNFRRRVVAAAGTMVRGPDEAETETEGLGS
jgi:flagellar protein FlbD